MGAVEMKKQQINKMKHEQAEQAVKQVASSSGGTAQVLRTAASQTDKPIMTIAGTQSDKPVTTSSGTQSDGPQTQIFDMALDEKVSDFADKIETESAKQASVKNQKIRNIPQLIADHLGERLLSPNVRSMVSFIERGLPSSSNQPMQLEQIAQPVLTQLEPTLTRPVGRPRKTPTTDNKPGPMSIEPQKRKTELGSPGKDRAQAKKKEKREQEMTRNYLEAIKNEGLNEPEKTPPQPASSSTGGSSTDIPKNKPQKSSSTGGSTNMPKKTIIKTSTITKQTAQQLSPSVIGIQRLREAFLEAKHTKHFKS
jgi:hypothetical protein